MFVGDHSRELLIVTLEAAVPIWIIQMQEQPWEYIESRAKECSKIIAEKGDNILFRSNREGETAAAFNALAEGIACLAYLPGGVTVFGRHWEAKYEDQDH